MYLTDSLKLSSKKEDGATFAIFDNGNGRGHSIKDAKSNKFLSVSKQNLTLASKPATFKVVSVTL